MRKILSIITAFTLLLSLFSFLPSTFQIAAAAAPDVAVTTFDGDAEAAYLADNNRFSYAKIVDSGDPERGNYAQFTINGNTDGWPQAVKLINADKTASYEVEQGKSYYLNFDLKRANTASNSFYIGIVILQDGNSCSNLGALNSWNITSFWYSNVNDSSWGLQRNYFTASSSGQPALVVYKTSYGEVKDAQILIDNITVVEATNYTTVNFEEEQDSYYGTPNRFGQVSVIDTGDSAYGNVVKYTSISSEWNNQWPQCTFICDATASASFRVKEGINYKVTYNIKRVNVTSDFSTGLFYPDNPETSAGNPGKIENKKYYLNYFNAASNGEWETVSAEFTAVKDSTLLFVIYKNVSSNINNQEILFDNIRIEEFDPVNVTYHYNNGEADETLSVSVGSAYKTPSLAGAEFAGWYYDEDLTQPAGSVVEDTCELYAKWSSYSINFDDRIYTNGMGAFNVAENMGISNTNAYRAEARTNTAWPNRFSIKNADGSNFTLKGGHHYTITLQVKVLEPEKLVDSSLLLPLSTGGDLGSNGSNIGSFKFVDDEFREAQEYLRPFYVVNGMDFSGFKEVIFNFIADESQNGSQVYITQFNVNSAVLIDNVTIKDNDAVKTVNAGGTELKGYAGDKLVLPDPDAEGNTNFVGWSETENGEYYSGSIFTKDMELYAVESQLAVVKTTADRMADTISFKVRYEDLVFSETATGITVTGITVNGIVYPINEIGLLAVPTEKLTGAALTLENADGVGAVRISNSALKYSAAADGTLEISATVSLDGQTAKYDREYTVVAYAVYGASNTVYSRTKAGIATSFTDALGLNPVAAGDYQHGDYKLVFNSEFGDGESLTDNWYYWTGSNSYDDLKNYSVPYEETANISDGTLNLSAKKISDTNVIKGELLSNKIFTNGYIEARIKMSSQTLSAFSFWLNSAGMSESDLIIKPEGDSTYVYPEIDIAEMFSGSNNQISTTLHFWDFSGTAIQRQQLRIGDYDLNTAEYHIYGLERTTDKIAVFIDGIEVYSITKQQILDEPADRTAEEIAAIFENPVYIILGQSIISADIDETVTTNIDYVRVYE